MSHAGVALVNPQVIFDKAGIHKGMHVADFGCGRTGHFVFSLSRLVADVGVVYAVDVLKEVLVEIKSRCRSGGYENVQTIWSDIELPGRTAIPAETVDAIFFVNVLSLLKQHSAALGEAGRIIKPGGRVVVVDWSKNLGAVGPRPDALISPAIVIQKLQDSNFELVEQQSAGDYHYYVIGRKKVL